MKSRVLGIRLLIFSLLIILLLFGFLYARMGGGGSFSSGGGGGGGGGDSDIEFIFWIIMLCFEYPEIGIPLLIIVCIYVFIKWIKEKMSPSPSAEEIRLLREKVDRSNPEISSTYQGVRKRANEVNQQIKELKAIDPNFSRVVFLDFIQILYHRFQHARYDPKERAAIEPYLDVTTRTILTNLSSSNLKEIEDIVIGSIRLLSVSGLNKDSHTISVLLETNYTEVYKDDRFVSFYTKETWTYSRKKGILSRSPEEIKSFHCPNCGAPTTITTQCTCEYCGNPIKAGSSDWVLHRLLIGEKRQRTPVQVSSGIEVGTDLPTVFDPDYERERKAFIAVYPDFNWQEFQDYVKLVFVKLQEAWGELDWQKARPFQTDYLFQTLNYWMINYKEAGLKNIIKDIEINNIIPVKIERDVYYDAFTMRIEARMVDYVINSEGKILQGSSSSKRTFSEYWTFVRRAGFKGKSSLNPEKCPNCGAELNINQAGYCEYCKAKITSGSFDWILALIEQDEVYSG